MQSTSHSVSKDVSINPSSLEQISINHIFSHNHNWDVYRREHKDELRDVEIKGVEKRCFVVKIWGIGCIVVLVVGR